MRNLKSPRTRRRQTDPMREFDALPPELRQWLASACLPWSPRSVRRLWQRAMRAHANRQRALEALQASENRTIAREARLIWGAAYPAASAGNKNDIPPAGKTSISAPPARTRAEFRPLPPDDCRNTVFPAAPACRKPLA